jgi:hypothetical protein
MGDDYGREQLFQAVLNKEKGLDAMDILQRERLQSIADMHEESKRRLVFIVKIL